MLRSEQPHEILPPFANYNRAHLERLVQEWFEYIEVKAHSVNSPYSWGAPSGYPIDPFHFQVLMAADYYLRTTE